MADVLVIDNFDSFTFNLVDAIATAGHTPHVYRNTLPVERALELLDTMRAPRVVLSPGPGHPRDAGCCMALIRRCPVTVPLLGVCLGHQAIVEAFGGVVSHAPEVVHGRASTIRHDGEGLFAGLRSPLPVARYHSLAAHTVGPVLEISARLASAPDVCMAARHRDRPIFGLQFHPESILTPDGGRILSAFLNHTGAPRDASARFDGLPDTREVTR